jgi:hypothetical protein
MCPPEVECTFNLELVVTGRSKLVCFSAITILPFCLEEIYCKRLN